MIRIVFVDDEVSVLQAMRRAMRSMINEWDMEYLQSGAAPVGCEFVKFSSGAHRCAIPHC